MTKRSQNVMVPVLLVVGAAVELPLAVCSLQSLVAIRRATSSVRAGERLQR